MDIGSLLDPNSCPTLTTHTCYDIMSMFPVQATFARLEERGFVFTIAPEETYYGYCQAVEIQEGTSYVGVADTFRMGVAAADGY